MATARIIERQNGITLHHQIRLMIDQMAREQPFAQGSPLPSEESLCEEFKVSRGTVRRAILDLVQEGILFRISGKGTFVNNRRRPARPTKIITVVIDWGGEREFHWGQYEGLMMKGINDSLAQRGYSINLKTFAACEALNPAAYHQTDGMMIINPRKHFLGSLERLTQLEVPFVVAGANLRQAAINNIAVDQPAAMQTAVAYLLALGHRKIAFITGDQDIHDSYERATTYQHLCQSNGLSESWGVIFAGQRPWKDQLQEKFSDWQARQALPSAVITGGFGISLMLIAVLRSLGLAIPGDISVLGFDDFPAAAQLTPPLTAIIQPIYEMATEATRILLEEINDRSPDRRKQQKIYPARLIVRASCGRGPEIAI